MAFNILYSNESYAAQYDRAVKDNDMDSIAYFRPFMNNEWLIEVAVKYTRVDLLPKIGTTYEKYHDTIIDCIEKFQRYELSYLISRGTKICICTALRYHDIEFLDEHYSDCQYTRKHLEVAVETHNYAKINFVLNKITPGSNIYNMTNDIAEYALNAAFAWAFEDLIVFIMRRYRVTLTNPDWVASQGHVRLLRKYGFDPNKYAYSLATGGHLSAIGELQLARGSTMAYLALMGAIHGGHIHIVSYLFDNFLVDTAECSRAIMGFDNMLSPGARSEDRIFEEAIAAESIEVYLYLLKRFRANMVDHISAIFEHEMIRRYIKEFYPEVYYIEMH